MSRFLYPDIKVDKPVLNPKGQIQKPEYQKLYEEGMQLYQDKDYSAALSKFEKAFAGAEKAGVKNLMMYANAFKLLERELKPELYNPKGRPALIAAGKEEERNARKSLTLASAAPTKEERVAMAKKALEYYKKADKCYKQADPDSRVMDLLIINLEYRIENGTI